MIKYIKGAGLYRNKSKNIIETCKQLINIHDGKVPDTRDELRALPGVGRKTANVVLANAYNIPTIAVDTHVFRVANRLGLAKAKTPLAVERQLTSIVPKSDWILMHHLLISHGRKICSARNPGCTLCFLINICKHKERSDI